MNKYCDIAPPYFMIDEIIDIIPGQSIHGVKNISFSNLTNLHSDLKINGKHIFPQSLVIEVFAQFFITTLCAENDVKYSDTKLFECYAEFFHPCYVGSQIEVFAEIDIKRQGIFIGTAKGYNKNDLIGQSRLKIVVPKIWNEFAKVTRVVK